MDTQILLAAGTAADPAHMSVFQMHVLYIAPRIGEPQMAFSQTHKQAIHSLMNWYEFIALQVQPQHANPVVFHFFAVVRGIDCQNIAKSEVFRGDFRNTHFFTHLSAQSRSRNCSQQRNKSHGTIKTQFSESTRAAQLLLQRATEYGQHCDVFFARQFFLQGDYLREVEHSYLHAAADCQFDAVGKQFIITEVAPYGSQNIERA